MHACMHWNEYWVHIFLVSDTETWTGWRRLLELPDPAPQWKWGLTLTFHGVPGGLIQMIYEWGKSNIRRAAQRWHETSFTCFLNLPGQKPWVACFTEPALGWCLKSYQAPFPLRFVSDAPRVELSQPLTAPFPVVCHCCCEGWGKLPSELHCVCFRILEGGTKVWVALSRGSQLSVQGCRQPLFWAELERVRGAQAL